MLSGHPPTPIMSHHARDESASDWVSQTQHPREHQGNMLFDAQERSADEGRMVKKKGGCMRIVRRCIPLSAVVGRHESHNQQKRVDKGRISSQTSGDSIDERLAQGGATAPSPLVYGPSSKRN